MPEPTSWRELNARYAPLAERNHLTLSADEARSLMCLRTDRAIRAHAVERDSVDRVVVWLRNMRAVEKFAQLRGRLPRDNRRAGAPEINSEERRLEQWLNYQSRLTTIDLHCSYQTECLALLPGYSSDRMESRWRSRLNSYANFTSTRGYAPRLRSSDECERALARWASKQRLARRDGTLSTQRHEGLSALGFWTWGSPRI